MSKKTGQGIRPIKDLSGGLVDAFADGQFRLLFGLTCSVTAGAAVVYRLLEGWTWIDAFYFATVTIATVGYGDIVPVTSAGKLFTIFYIVIGVGLFVAAAAALAGHVTSHAWKDRVGTEARPGATPAPPDEP